MLPLIAQPNFLVETLTSLQVMNEEDERKFLLTYLKFYHLHGTNDPDDICGALKLPPYSTPEAKVRREVESSRSYDESGDSHIKSTNSHDDIPISEQLVKYHICCPWQDVSVFSTSGRQTPNHPIPDRRNIGSAFTS